MLHLNVKGKLLQRLCNYLSCDGNDDNSQPARQEEDCATAAEMLVHAAFIRLLQIDFQASYYVSVSSTASSARISHPQFIQSIQQPETTNFCNRPEQSIKLTILSD